MNRGCADCGSVFASKVFQHRATTLVLITVAALLLRMPGFLHGLPTYPDADEPTVISIAVRIFKGEFNPHFFNYPSLYLYLNAGLVALTHVVYHGLRIVGVFESPSTPYWLFFAASRLFNIALSIGSIVLMYLIGRCLADRKLGLLSAAILCVFPLHVQHSVRVAPNMLLLVCVGACIYASLRFLVYPGYDIRWLYVSSVAAGLAVGTKYMAPIALPPLFALLVRGESGSGFGRGVHAVGCLAAMLAAFVVTTPYAVVAFPEFASGLLYEHAHYTAGHPGAEARWALTRLAVNLFRRGATPLPLLTGVAGVVMLSIARWKSAGVILLGPMLWFGLMGSYSTTFARNILPLAYVISAGAAYAISRVKPSRAGVVLFLAVLVKPVSVDIKHILYRMRPDIRYVAGAWIAENIPEGSHIAREAYTCMVDGDRFESTFIGICGLAYIAPDSLRRAGCDYVIAASHARFESSPGEYPRETAVYGNHLRRFETVKVFEPGRTYQGSSIRILKVR